MEREEGLFYTEDEGSFSERCHLSWNSNKRKEEAMWSLIAELAGRREECGGLQAALSLAYSRDSKAASALPCACSMTREEKADGRYSQRGIIFPVHLFIICPLLQEWNLLQETRVTSIMFTRCWFMWDTQEIFVGWMNELWVVFQPVVLSHTPLEL